MSGDPEILGLPEIQSGCLWVRGQSEKVDQNMVSCNSERPEGGNPAHPGSSPVRGPGVRGSEDQCWGTELDCREGKEMMETEAQKQGGDRTVREPPKRELLPFSIMRKQQEKEFC